MLFCIDGKGSLSRIGSIFFRDAPKLKLKKVAWNTLSLPSEPVIVVPPPPIPATSGIVMPTSKVFASAIFFRGFSKGPKGLIKSPNPLPMPTCEPTLKPIPDPPITPVLPANILSSLLPALQYYPQGHRCSSGLAVYLPLHFLWSTVV